MPSLHVLLAGGEARVFSPQRADGLYGDLRAVVQFFCPYEAEALRAVLAQEVALLRAVVDVMQVPSLKGALACPCSLPLGGLPWEEARA